MFWFLCVVMVAIALAFILPTLLQTKSQTDNSTEAGRTEANLDVYRDQLAELSADFENGLIEQNQYDQDRNELERRLLEDVSNVEKASSDEPALASAGRNTTYLIALGIPIIAVALYLRFGHYTAMSESPTPTRQVQAAPEEPAETPAEGMRSQEEIAANVTALAKRLEQNPDDLQGWIMLGRSYMTFKKYPEASSAYAKATALKPNDADLLADYAFALAMANGQRLEGQPAEVIEKARKIDPKNVKVLELAGSVAFQKKDYKLAIRYWEELLQKLPNDSEVKGALTQRIDEAKQLAETNK